MGIEKPSNYKGGNYVGGFLQLFDWNAKSRKKLFSNKLDLPENSKQKKRVDGTLPTTRLQMMDEDEIGAGSSFKGSVDHSCASSVTDEDFYGSRGPGVVARLMGLDSMPKSNTPDPSSTPLFDCQSLPCSYYKSECLEYNRDPQIMEAAVAFNVEPKYQKAVQRPIEKFQTEVLPPRSAKSVPITHHKLLSPIKSPNFIPSKDAAEIMEAAARIIEPSQATKRKKLPLAGSSSSGPLKVKDLKEKVQVGQKSLKMSESSQKGGESSGAKHVKGNTMNRSCNGGGSLDATPMRIFQESEESSSGVKSKGKLISLALQAKANVQKREASSLNSSRRFANNVENNEFSLNMLFTSQSGAQKSTLKKPSTHNSSNVLRPNNQKQNCSDDGGKLSSKSNLQSGKSVNGEVTSTKRQSSSKLVDNSKASSRKLSSEVKDDKRNVLSCSSERTRKKRSVDGNYRSEKNQTCNEMQMDKKGEATQSGGIRDCEMMETDVISFTFTAPMRSNEVQENCKIFSADSPSKRIMLNSDGMSVSKFSFLAHNVNGGNTLSTFLEQQLKELAHKVELSQQKSGAVSLTSEERNTKDGDDPVDQQRQRVSSLYSLRDAKGTKTGQKLQGLVEEKGRCGGNVSEDHSFLHFRFPSPVSVLEHSSINESCHSSESAESNLSTGGDINCAPLQYRDNLSRHSMNTSEGDAEFSDSASSTSAGSQAKRKETTLTRSWELEYVKKMLCNIDQMFNDYAMGRACEIINPHLFEQLERCQHYFNHSEVVSRTKRRLLFDCASECLERRCRKHGGGGFKMWGKGVWMVKHKDRLAEDVYNEISGWSAMGDCMVDELVDRDMSRDPWLDFEIQGYELGMKIESRILNSLIDEVVADILLLL